MLIDTTIISQIHIWDRIRELCSRSIRAMKFQIPIQAFTKLLRTLPIKVLSPIKKRIWSLRGRLRLLSLVKVKDSILKNLHSTARWPTIAKCSWNRDMIISKDSFKWPISKRNFWAPGTTNSWLPRKIKPKINLALVVRLKRKRIYKHAPTLPQSPRKAHNPNN